MLSHNRIQEEEEQVYKNYIYIVISLSWDFKRRDMEWRKCYLDVILVPLGFLTSIGYHFWLWHKVRTQPHTTIIGINASGRRNWVNAMMKVPSYLIFILVFSFGLLRVYIILSLLFTIFYFFKLPVLQQNLLL